MAEKKKYVPPDVAQVWQLEEVISNLKNLNQGIASIRREQESSVPEGITEPIESLTITDDPTTVNPPHYAEGKYWFSIVIVKEDEVALHLIINTEKSGTTPYTMSANEKVYDQYFSKPLIKDLMLWTDSGETCTVKIRGSR